MCGRYALWLRPSQVRQQLEESHMPVNDAPDDDSIRQSYNFAPGYHGLVYRADMFEHGSGSKEEEPPQDADAGGQEEVDSPKYKLQAMKWGLVPFWTKRNPDYRSMIKTINCRDDSLYEDRGMWTSMKKKKRCIIIAQGFFEWLKKNNSKEKLPHYTTRSDGQLMCFAGLWDSVQYEDSDEKLFTYSIITTDSNKQLQFLHDRMPVILDNGSDAIRTWLDPRRTEWSDDLQKLLKPFQGGLECFPVVKDVGKVGNNSPSFVVPIDSSANKSNIANFFGNQQKAARTKREKQNQTEEADAAHAPRVEEDSDEPRATTNNVGSTENNAPLPVSAFSDTNRGKKRHTSHANDDEGHAAAVTPPPKRRNQGTPTNTSDPRSIPKASASKGTRSATSNGKTTQKASKSGGSKKITSFFGK